MEITKTTPAKYRDIKFTKTKTLLGQQISLNTTTKDAQDILNKAKTAWGLIKHRAFIDHGVQKTARLQLWNAAIYSILGYGRCALRITEAMQITIHQFSSECIRCVVEDGKHFGGNPDEWANEHDKNEEMRRINGIPTIESKLRGGQLCNIYRWYATKAIAYLNNKSFYRADIEHLSLKCERMQLIIRQKRKNYVPNQKEHR